ncbi:hypothetical protein L596_022681 [Steinernema carpocapsae]|uniref:Uncharacterized protein n=1 Tax=Steinernema carpocapsae TaxID=34508 RepID=A0A4U5MMU3_STECR|nr:hypothetical protein L596_022681 [Steinernema carpocapsae]
MALFQDAYHAPGMPKIIKLQTARYKSPSCPSAPAKPVIPRNKKPQISLPRNINHAKHEKTENRKRNAY